MELSPSISWFSCRAHHSSELSTLMYLRGSGQHLKARKICARTSKRCCPTAKLSKLREFSVGETRKQAEEQPGIYLQSAGGRGGVECVLSPPGVPALDESPLSALPQYILCIWCYLKMELK